MKELLENRGLFVKFEGDIFKIIKIESGFDAFKFVNNSWERVDDRLIATLFFWGVPVKDPSIADS